MSTTTTAKTPQLPDDDRRILRAALRDLFSLRRPVYVYDPEADENVRATTAAKAYQLAAQFDDSFVYVDRDEPGRGPSWARFVFGNGDASTLADYTTDLGDVLANTEALADKLAEQLARR